LSLGLVVVLVVFPVLLLVFGLVIESIEYL
jgi:hypothetical protein